MNLKNNSVSNIIFTRENTKENNFDYQSLASSRLGGKYPFQPGPKT
jgi:hypothetical protein